MSSKDKTDSPNDETEAKDLETDQADSTDVTDAEGEDQDKPEVSDDESSDDAVEPFEETPIEDAEIVEDAEELDAETAEASAEAGDLADEASDSGASDDTEAAADPVTEEPDPLPEAETPSDPAPTPVPPAPEQKSSGGGFVPAVLGGLVAAGLGYGVATYVNAPKDDGAVEAAITDQGEKLAALETKLGELTESISAPASDPVIGQLEALASDLETRFSGISGDLESRFSDISGSFEQIGSRFDDVTEQTGGVSGLLDGLRSKLDDLDSRLASVESRPLMESSETAKAAYAAYERQVEDLRQSLESQRNESSAAAAALSDSAQAAKADLEQAQQEARAQLEKTRADAEAAAKAREDEAKAELARIEAAAQEAEKKAAVSTLERAMLNGQPYASALAVLSKDATIPDILTANAETGITSLSNLQAQFPELARESLDASIKETVSDDTVGRVTAFLRSQTGARSLTPLEGDHPDAVLSRAESAVAAGELSLALTEIKELPETGQAAFADWIAAAENRVAVLTAANDLTADVQAN